MCDEPSCDDIELGSVLAALADPQRRKVIRELGKDRHDQPHSFASFGLAITKATRTHHFKVLREAGLVHHVDHGNHRTAQLRRKDIDTRFPGLLNLVISEKPPR